MTRLYGSGYRNFLRVTVSSPLRAGENPDQARLKAIKHRARDSVPFQ